MAEDRSTQAIRRSVEDPFDPSQGFGGMFGSEGVLWLASAADDTPPWGWSTHRERDKKLRQFISQETVLSSAVYTVAAQNASLTWELEGPPNTVRAAQDMLHEANWGDGWTGFITQLSLDLYSQDNGAFIEIVRRGPSETDAVVGIKTLDARRCLRTGDPFRPVVYWDREGKRHELKRHQVIIVAELPSASEWDRGIQYCLAGDSQVRMADGTSERIRTLVREKSNRLVLSVNERGELEPRPITAWYENQRNGRSWVNVRGALSQLTRGDKSRNSWVTEDHPILTPSGWVNAGRLQPGDPIVTEAPSPNSRQIRLVIGTMLGDASMRRTGDRASLSVSHLTRNADWLELKHAALSEFGWTQWHDEVRGMSHSMTKAQAAFVGLRSTFYRNGEKRIPLDLLKRHLSPELLAAWYLDDGTIYKRLSDDHNRRPTARIGTCGYPDEDVQGAADILTAAGFDCRLYRAGKDIDGYHLGFSVKGSAALFAYIAPLVPPSMRYKLPPESEPFDMGRWNLGTAERFIDRAVVSRDGPPSAQTVYCIDVEGNHNFITAGVVVHNCALTRVLKAAQIMRSVQQYQDEKISGRDPTSIWLVSGVQTKQITDAIRQAKENADNRGSVRFMPPVLMGGIDPSLNLNTTQINLASLPEGFDYEVWNKWYIAQVAMAFGRDYQDFAPLPGRGIGTGAEAETLAMKSRGKGQGLFIKKLAHLLNFYGVLPRSVTFRWDESDPDFEQREEQARKLRAERFQIYTTTGVLTPAVARQLLQQDGDIPQEALDLMTEEDKLPNAAVNDDTQANEQGRTEGEMVDEDVSGTQATGGARALKGRDAHERMGRATNAYQDKLVASAQRFIDRAARELLDLAPEERSRRLPPLIQDFEAELLALGDRELPKAYRLAAPGRMLSDLDQQRIRQATARNATYVRESLVPYARQRIMEAFDEADAAAGMAPAQDRARIQRVRRVVRDERGLISEIVESFEPKEPESNGRQSDLS